MGPCNSGYWESPAASPVGLNGRSRYRGSQGRVPGGVCIFPISVWSGMACRRKRLAVLLEAVQCSYLVSEKSVRRRTSFLGNHDTFWRSSLPRRALQTRARRLAREGPSFTVRTCTTAGGRKWGTLRRKTKTRVHILGHLSTVSDPGGSPPELFPECSTPDFGSSGTLFETLRTTWKGTRSLRGICA